MRVIESPYPLAAEERERMINAWEVLSGGADLSKICFIDIETTGFSRLYCSIYLIGYIAWENGSFVTRQFLADDERDEPVLLQKTVEDLMRFTHVVTYNGDMFDIPFIVERAKRLHVWSLRFSQWQDSMTSVDLMKRYKRTQRFFGWPDMKLKTVEACLGAGRRDPFDGGQLIEVFEEYSRTQDEYLMRELLLHNYEDIVNLLFLLKAEQFLSELRNGRALEVSLEGKTLSVLWDRILSLDLVSTCPLDGAKKGSLKKAKTGEGVPAGETPAVTFGFRAGSAQFTIELPQTEDESCLSYFLPHPEDYYYLPETNEIVHKSLAFDIPASARKKAKAEQCCLAAPEGIYLGSVPVPPCGADEETAIDLKACRRSVKDQAVYYIKEDLSGWLAAANSETLALYIGGFFRPFL